MTIDILFLLIVLFGFYKGYSKGLVMAALSLIGYIAAIFTTMYCTQKFIAFIHWQSPYAPIVCYVGLFIGVIILFRLLGKMIEGMLELVELNFVNKLIGGVVGSFIGIAIFSSLIWLLIHVDVLPKTTIATSKVVSYLIPVGHYVIEMAGKLFPVIKEFFTHLKNQLQQLTK